MLLKVECVWYELECAWELLNLNGGDCGNIEVIGLADKAYVAVWHLLPLTMIVTDPQ